jgi:hypothetical protein
MARKSRDCAEAYTSWSHKQARIDAARTEKDRFRLKLFNMTGKAQGTPVIFNGQVLLMHVSQIMTRDAVHLAIFQFYPLGRKDFGRSKFPFFAKRRVLLQDRVGGIKFAIRRAVRNV